VIVLRNVAARPAKEGGLDRTYALEHVRPYAVRRIARQQRHLIDPYAPGPREEDGESGKGIAPLGPKRERVPPPIAGHVSDLRGGVNLSAADVGFERHRDGAGVTGRLEPEIAVVGHVRPDRESGLMDASPFNHAGAGVDT
jgi:hypothetical protein